MKREEKIRQVASTEAAYERFPVISKDLIDFCDLVAVVRRFVEGRLNVDDGLTQALRVFDQFE